MTLVSTIGFLSMPDIVLWPTGTLDNALGVKSKMTAISARSNNKLDIIFD